MKNYTFRACFIDSFQGTVGANFALNSLKAKNAAIITDSSSDYSKGLTQVFKEAFTKGGGQIVSEEAYLQKDQDFKPVLTKIKAQNPDLLYIPGYYEDVEDYSACELGISVLILGRSDVADSPNSSELGGAEALNHTYFTNFYSVEDKLSFKPDAFVEAYQKEYGQLPDSYGGHGI